MTDLARTLALDETRIGYHFVGATLPVDGGTWLDRLAKFVHRNARHVVDPPCLKLRRLTLSL